jgi:16S rRNA (cytosine967-C5)-methyltransferase
LSYVYTYLTVAEKLIGEYTYPTPLHLFLKKYFSQNKKHGSRDRKTITALCYSYYRTGKNFSSLSIADKILIGFALSQSPYFGDAWQQKLNEQFPLLKSDFTALPQQEQLSELQKNYSFDAGLLFPIKNGFSTAINNNDFLTSLLAQPNVWLRAKRNKKENVVELLANANIAVVNHTEVANAIGLAQQINIEQVLGKNHHHLVEVQDASSQQTGNFIALAPYQKVWDCCCGAGGKSLMLKDIEHKIELYCSDIRPQIIENLKERFKQSGLPSPFEVALDITNNHTSEITFETKSERRTATKNHFDAIVADVPCTGSGTWARTPEQAFYFNESIIAEYAQKQKDIVNKTVPYLKKGSKLYYITCSVFEAENEAQLAYFETLGLKIEQHHLIAGYTHQADSMFIAVLEKV